MASEQQQLRQAHQLLKEKKYDQARYILEQIPFNVTAEKWLDKLDRIAPVRNKPVVANKQKLIRSTSRDLSYVQPHSANPYGNNASMAAFDDYSMGAQMQRAMASSKSYVGAAIITFIASGFFWIPGLIFNLMYLNEAKKMQKVAGHSLPGVGCLWIMLVLNLLPFLLLCGLLA